MPSTQNRGNFRNNKPNWNRNKKSWKPQKKPFVKNNNWKPKDNNKPKTEKDLSNITSSNCNKKGHYANTCPEENKTVTSAAQSVQQRTTYRKKPFIRSAATYIQTKDKEKELNQILNRRSEHMVIDVKLDGHPAKALVDQLTTGASLISSTYTSTYNLPIIELPEDVTDNFISKKKFRRDPLHLQVRPLPAPYFIVRQLAPCIYISALSALKFHLSPYPQLHLPARPIHTHTSTFPSLLLGQLALVARLGMYTRSAP